MKVLFGMVPRQTSGFVENPLAADVAGVRGACLQHRLPTPKDDCAEYSISWREGLAAQAYR